MNASAIDAICRQVYRQFPEVNGAKPKVQNQGDTGNVQLVFKGQAQAADGRPISRVVRVVASENGKIIKMTTSR